MPEVYSLNPKPSSRGSLSLAGLQQPPQAAGVPWGREEAFWALDPDPWSQPSKEWHLGSGCQRGWGSGSWPCGIRTGAGTVPEQQAPLGPREPLGPGALTLDAPLHTQRCWLLLLTLPPRLPLPLSHGFPPGVSAGRGHCFVYLLASQSCCPWGIRGRWQSSS